MTRVFLFLHLKLLLRRELRWNTVVYRLSEKVIPVKVNTSSTEFCDPNSFGIYDGICCRINSNVFSKF